MNEKKEISFCPFCGTKLNSPTIEPNSKRRKQTQRRCSSCDRMINSAPAIWATKHHEFEYKSKWTIFHWPIVHIAFGTDAVTNKPKVARGLIAIGSMATGGIAIGGLAIGGIALGGSSLGLVSFGGVAAGVLFAFGGCAIGTGLSIGGFALGTMALGGGAVGYYAIGGGAYGVVAFGGNMQDPFALAFFKGWRGMVAMVVNRFSSIVVALILAPILLIPFVQLNNSPADGNIATDKQTEQLPVDQSKRKPSRFGLLILMLLGSIFGIALVWLGLVFLNLYV